MEWPKCEECEGTGRISLSGKVSPAPFTCPVCHGSGERDLTADEAARVIWEAGMVWLPRPVDNAVEVIIYPAREKGLLGMPDVYEPGFRQVAETEGHAIGSFLDLSLTAALNAAARAVYERGKE